MKDKSEGSLSPEKLQLFLAGIRGLDPVEVRKAKLLYLRNSVSEYEALVEANRASRRLNLFFPPAWIFAAFASRQMATAEKLARDRIRNAVEVWKDDLAGETFVVGDETIHA